MANPLPVARLHLGEDTGRQRLGELEESLIVEQRQRLQRRVGTVPPGAGAVGVGSIEDRQAGVWGRPPEVGIHAPAVAVRAGVRFPVLVDLREAVDTLRLWRG